MKAYDVIYQPKEVALQQLTKNQDLVQEVFNLALSHDKKAWKAAWVLNQAVQQNKIELSGLYDQVWASVLGKPANHRRELLKLLEHCELTEANEGSIFDVAVSCWEQPGAQPSSRMVAFRLMLKVAKRHEGLIAEIEALTDDQLLEGLSPGIKRSVEQQLKSLQSLQNSRLFT